MFAIFDIFDMLSKSSHTLKCVQTHSERNILALHGYTAWVY